MTSTFAESLRRAIEEDDSKATVALLEPRMHDGAATESESLLCGVLLLLPPLADYEAAANIFSGLLDGERRFEAAVWDAYRFAVLLPTGDRPFEAVLRLAPWSAVAAHMLSKVADMCGDMPLALAENRRSRALRLFPFNLIHALRLESGRKMDERREYWRTACDLFVSRSAELDAKVCTVEGALHRLFENLIVGTRITEPLWNYYSKIFGKL